MQERTPAQPVNILRREPELLGDELGQRAHPLGMPAGPPVVRVQRGAEHHDLFRPERVAAVHTDRLDPRRERTLAAGTQREAESRRCRVGEDQ